MSHSLECLVVHMLRFMIELDLRTTSRAHLLLGFAALEYRTLISTLRQTTFFLWRSLVRLSRREIGRLIHLNPSVRPWFDPPLKLW